MVRPGYINLNKYISETWSIFYRSLRLETST